NSASSLITAINSKEILSGLDHLSQHYPQIIEKVHKFESLFLDEIKASILESRPLRSDLFQQMTRFLSDKIIPTLPESQQMISLETLKNHPESLENLVRVLKYMQDDVMYTKVDHFLAKDKLNQSFLLNSVQHQFLLHLKNTINTTSLV